MAPEPAVGASFPTVVDVALVEVIGWIGATLFAFCGAPQALKTYRTKRAEDISWAFLFMWIGGGPDRPARQECKEEQDHTVPVDHRLASDRGSARFSGATFFHASLREYTACDLAASPSYR